MSMIIEVDDIVERSLINNLSKIAKYCIDKYNLDEKEVISYLNKHGYEVDIIEKKK